LKDLFAELLGTGLSGLLIALYIVLFLIVLATIVLLIVLVRTFLAWRRRQRLGQYEDIIRKGEVADPFLGWLRSQGIEVGSLSPRSLADLQDRYNREVVEIGKQ